MWLDELSELVDDLAACIDTHRDILNESTTRYALIDPLLNALGWRLSDPAQVRTEYTTDTGKRLDYAMLQDKRICLVVEAKRFGEALALDDRATNQAITYCYQVGCPHFLVTDGNHWHGYALMGEGELRDRQMLNFTVKKEVRSIMDLFWLWPGNFKGKTTQPNLHGRPAEIDVSRNTTPSDVRQHTASGTPLPRAYTQGMDKPRCLIFPDGETKDVSDRWWRIQAATAEWLIDHNHVTRLPVQTAQGVLLLYKKRTNRDAPPFSQPKEVRGHWIDAHANAKQHFTKARQLLELCEVDPNTVHVELS